jgi:hypothetical protein
MTTRGVYAEVDEQGGAGAPGVVHGDLADPGGGTAEIPGAVEVPRLDGGAVPGREHETKVVPGCAGRHTSRLLVRPVPSERNHTDARQRQCGVGLLGLRLPVQQLPADPLELVAHPQLACVSVDVGPGESQDLALAESERENQDKGGVEKVVGVPRRLQEPPSLFAAPGPALTRTLADRFVRHQRGDVPGNQLLGHRLRERRPQSGTDAFERSPGGQTVAAAADRTAPSLVLGPGGVLALGTALAGGRDPVYPRLDVPDRVQLLGTEAGDQVDQDQRLVGGVSEWRPVGLDDLAEPVREVRARVGVWITPGSS